MSKSPPKLSVREEQILVLICEGWSRYEIADMMCKSHYTIANHLKSVRIKTGCSKVAQLVMWAVRNGIATP